MCWNVLPRLPRGSRRPAACCPSAAAPDKPDETPTDAPREAPSLGSEGLKDSNFVIGMSKMIIIIIIKIIDIYI